MIVRCVSVVDFPAKYRVFSLFFKPASTLGDVRPSKRFAEHFFTHLEWGHKTRTGTLNSADRTSAPLY